MDTSIERSMLNINVLQFLPINSKPNTGGRVKAQSFLTKCLLTTKRNEKSSTTDITKEKIVWLCFNTILKVEPTCHYFFS